MIIGIVGATSLVGICIEESLNKLNILKSIDSVLRYSTSGDNNTIKFELNYLKDLDYAFLATPNKLSREIYEYCKQNNFNTILIDSSSEFRMDPLVPLIIPEVNGYLLNNNLYKLIASPNCTTIFLTILLKALESCGNIKCVTLSTYQAASQAASGVGIKGVRELIKQTEEYINLGEIIRKEFWGKSYAYNLFSDNSNIQENGYNEEEMKIVNETQKILEKEIQISPTCIRVPILSSHSESINVEFTEGISKDDIIKCLENFDGIKIINDNNLNTFPEPEFSSNKTEVYIGRIRSDLNDLSRWNFFICSDQILKGACYNSAQILQTLLKNN
jgi:aspartate-semialdehyde dehydrogenase